MTEKVFLKPNLLFEPLFNQWYAWSYLISPDTAAMFVANLHLKIMQSFVNAPAVTCPGAQESGDARRSFYKLRRE